MKWTDLVPGDMVIEGFEDGDLRIFILLCLNNMVPTWLSVDDMIHIVNSDPFDDSDLSRSILAVFNSSGEIRYKRQ